MTKIKRAKKNRGIKRDKKQRGRTAIETGNMKRT